ncbi:hypothetical protein BDV36DRAFT_300218 [Aspergillus pseudocaelatus]|uniref:Uncharacterized protein n=1 Tax=Aspergillus pseudocaelatus TaxID=1825620 RepID=A0ABQ6W7T5_9EURO|nr:hypothetical protein BDV36DRAFT_300218 [Aspergillus pseudocaelatus]
MVAITVPDNYGAVIGVALGAIPVLSFLHGMVVSGFRKEAKVPYPHSYATVEQCKSNAKAEQFNCAQRAHANFLENAPQTMLFTLVAGLKYPQLATALGAGWLVARSLFLYGYVYSGKPQDVYSLLECSIHCFSDVHHENYVLLRQRGEEISKGLTPEANTLTGARCSNSCELENVLKAVLELRKDSEKLQWYYRVNKEAVQRVFAKFAKFSTSTGEIDGIDGGPKAKWVKLEADRDESWLKYTGSLNELMGSIIQIRSDMKFYSNTKFCLKNVSSHPSLSGDPIRALNRAVIDDDAPELSKLLEAMYSNNTTTMPRFQEIARDLAGRSVACLSKQAAEYLLSQVFAQYHIALDNEILNQMIMISGRQGIFEEPTTVRMSSQCTPKASCAEPQRNLFSFAVKQLGLRGKNIMERQPFMLRLAVEMKNMWTYFLSMEDIQILMSQRLCMAGLLYSLHA